MPQHLILASTSPWRADLLARLGLPFVTEAPDVDESPLPAESALALATRLARLKAERVAQSMDRPVADNPCIIIGSDQVACLDSELLDKPDTLSAACSQLRRCSGRSVQFHTALCVRTSRNHTGNHLGNPLGNYPGSHPENHPGSDEVVCDLTTVHFRHLDTAEIERYVQADAPLGCAGGFKAEALGISLFERIESEDPTALVGLPLIALARLLRQAGLPLP